MPPIFSVSGNICEIDFSQYDDFSQQVEATLLKSMEDTEVKYLPVKKKDLAKSMVKKLLTKNNAEAICNFLINKPAEFLDTQKKYNYSKKGKITAKQAIIDGFFTTKVKTKPECPKSWEEGLYYYAGDPECEEVTNLIGEGKMPVAMYVISQSFSEASGVLTNPQLFKFHNVANPIPGLEIKGKQVNAPIACKGPKNEDAMYNFPYSSTFWDLRFIIGTKLVKTQSSHITPWFQIPSCTIEKTTMSEDKLLFNFGARVFLNIDVQINGNDETRTLVISYIGSTTESGGLLRSKFVSQAPKSFFNGELTKKYFFDLKYAGKEVLEK